MSKPTTKQQLTQAKANFRRPDPVTGLDALAKRMLTHSGVTRENGFYVLRIGGAAQIKSKSARAIEDAIVSASTAQRKIKGDSE